MNQQIITNTVHYHLQINSNLLDPATLGISFINNKNNSGARIEHLTNFNQTIKTIHL